MNVPPLRNPWTRFRAWVQANRAQAEILTIAGVAIGLIVVMMVVTVVVLVMTLR